MAPKRPLFVVPPPGKRLRVAAAAAASGSSSNPPASPGKRLRAFLLVVLFLKIRPKPKTVDSVSVSSQIARMDTKIGQICCSLDTITRVMGSIKEEIHALTQKVDNMTRSSPNQYNHEQVMRQEANQEGTSAEAEALVSTGHEGQSESLRLDFLNRIKTPVYHDDEIKSESHTSIKIGIFDGDNMIKSGELSNAQVEIMALEGDFPYDSRKSWPAKEFNKYIAHGRDGKGGVLAGEGTIVKLKNGECDLGSIRFREGSCRARRGKFIIGARVCDSEPISVRVQEAIMKPVIVQDRRNKSNEKSHPPKLQDRVHRLEEISKDGKYYKRLEKEKIFTVEDFLKALNKDPDYLTKILKINKEHKPWEKMIKHARECSLEGRHKLKLFTCTEKNVKLFFNCVHCLVGAAFFGGCYTPSRKFDSVQQELVDELKKSAYAELDVLPEDYVMTDNSPDPIHMDVYAGVGAGPSYVSSEQPNCSVRSAAVQVGGNPAVEGLILAQTEPSYVNVNCDFSHQVRSIPPAVEGLSHAQIESSFANARNDPGPNSSSSLNNLWQYSLGEHDFFSGTTSLSNMCQSISHEDVTLVDAQHQADTNSCVYDFNDVEIESLLYCPSNSIIDSSTSAHINTTLMPLLDPGTPISGPASMQSQVQTSLPPSNTAAEASASAQQALPPQKCSQSQENRTWNMLS